MKKIDLKILIITVIFCLLPILIGVSYYDSLPDKVAIHFDINGNPDGFMNKEWHVFGLPIFMSLIQIFCSVTVDLADKNKEANKKISIVSKWMIPVISICIYVITILYNLNYIVNIQVYVMLLLGLMFIVVGNYSPKTVGTAYTRHRFKDGLVQKRIAKIVSLVLILFGTLLIASIFFKPIVSACVVAGMIITVLVIGIYGLILDNRAIKNKVGKEKFEDNNDE